LNVTVIHCEILEYMVCSLMPSTYHNISFPEEFYRSEFETLTMEFVSL